MKHSSHAATLIAMQEADLAYREKLIQQGLLGKGYNAGMEKLHLEHATQLEKIIAEIGYPTSKKVGQQASEAAWLIVQHAISWPDFMKKCSRLLEQEVAQGNGNQKNLAYLIDRIATLEEKLQSYGTQFDWNEKGVLDPLPMEDISLVNARRKNLGLPTVEEQTKLLRQRAKQEGQQPPPDIKKHLAELRAWKLKVGWIS